jgi:hypothetical protein
MGHPDIKGVTVSVNTSYNLKSGKVGFLV